MRVDRRRHRQRHGAQILGGEAEVSGGAFRGSMAQQVADRFQGYAVAEQMESIRMAKAVNSLEGNFQSTPVRPRLKRLDHGRGFQRATRCLKPKENLPIGAIPRNLRQIIVNRRAERIRQGNSSEWPVLLWRMRKRPSRH